MFLKLYIQDIATTPSPPSGTSSMYIPLNQLTTPSSYIETTTETFNNNINYYYNYKDDNYIISDVDYKNVTTDDRNINKEIVINNISKGFSVGNLVIHEYRIYSSLISFFFICFVYLFLLLN